MIISPPTNDPIFLRQQIRELRSKAAQLNYQASRYEDDLVLIGSDADNQITVEVVAKVCGVMSVRISRLFSKDRTQHVAIARAVCAYILHRAYLWSYPRIGRALDRDHSTIIHARNLIQARMEQSGAFTSTMQKLLDYFNQQVVVALEDTNVKQSADSETSGGPSAGSSINNLPNAQGAAATSIQDRQRVAV